MSPVRLLPALPLIPLLVIAGSMAQELPSLGAGAPGELLEPSVTLREHDNRTVEEYRMLDNLYMVKVTPRVGNPYYLVDGDGSGDMSWSRGGNDIEQTVPRWTLRSW